MFSSPYHYLIVGFFYILILWTLTDGLLCGL